MEETLIDASPLIYFARMHRLAFLAHVVGPLAITPAVHRETVTVGRTRGFADADRIASAVADGLVLGLELTAEEIVIIERLRADPRIGPGECETVACAVARGLRAMIEDKRARRVAAKEGVRTLKSTDALYLALLRRHATLDEFRSMLRDLARITGIDPATLFEHEALAEEIASRLGQQWRTDDG